LTILCNENVHIKFINDIFLQAMVVVYNEFVSNGKIPVISSAADGDHSKDSYHKYGFAWDILADYPDDYETIYLPIRQKLKAIDKYYDLVFGTDDHKHHIHIEYDYRRYMRDKYKLNYIK